MLANDIKILNKKLQTEKQRRSYYEFFKQACLVLEPETDWSFNWHIKYICDELQKEVERVIAKLPKTSDLMINVPPGSSKSYMVSVCLAGWAWIHAPHLRIATDSYNHDLSIDHSRKARMVIESPWYQENWGHLYQLAKDENLKSVFSNTFGGERRAGIRTGKHFDILIADDPLDPRNQYSEPARNEAKAMVTTIMPTRVRDPKVALKIVIMQRLHEDDPCGAIEDKKLNYRKIVIPAELGSNVSPSNIAKFYKSVDGNKLFWPERFPTSRLKEMKDTLGSKDYAGQYDQKPSPDDGDVFKKQWFKFYQENELPNDLTWHYYTDSAFGSKNGDRSATACFTVYRGNMYIKAVLAKRLKLPKWTREYIMFVENTGGDDKSRHWIENKASAPDLEAVLRETTDLNLILDNTVNEQSKRGRAEASAPRLEGGRVYLLEGAHWVDEFVDELTKYPNGRFDDQVDMYSGATRKVDFRFSESIDKMVDTSQPDDQLTF